jgi:hypothetical protein
MRRCPEQRTCKLVPLQPRRRRSRSSGAAEKEHVCVRAASLLASRLDDGLACGVAAAAARHGVRRRVSSVTPPAPSNRRRSSSQDAEAAASSSRAPQQRVMSLSSFQQLRSVDPRMPLKSAQPRGVEPTRAAPPLPLPRRRAVPAEQRACRRHGTRGGGAATAAALRRFARPARPHVRAHSPLPAAHALSPRRVPCMGLSCARCPPFAAATGQATCALACPMPPHSTQKVPRPAVQSNENAAAAPDTAQRARTRPESLFAAPGSSPRTLPASPALALMPQPALPRLASGWRAFAAGLARRGLSRCEPCRARDRHQRPCEPGAATRAAATREHRIGRRRETFLASSASCPASATATLEVHRRHLSTQPSAKRGA